MGWCLGAPFDYCVPSHTHNMTSSELPNALSRAKLCGRRAETAAESQLLGGSSHCKYAASPANCMVTHQRVITAPQVLLHPMADNDADWDAAFIRGSNFHPSTCCNDLTLKV